MALIVEDGSIVDDANSFVSAVDATAFWTATSNAVIIAAWGGLTVAQQESSLIKATYNICRDFLFHGAAQDPTQRLCFPRTGLCDCTGRTVPQNTIPGELTEAVIIYAHYLSTLPEPDYFAITPDTDEDYGVKRVRDHDVEIEYFESRYFTTKGIKSKYPDYIFELLGCYSDTGNEANTGFVDRIVRL